MATPNVPEQPIAPLTAVGPSPELVTGLNAVSHVARALVAGGTFEELASRAVAEVVDALDLAIAALYLPHPGGEPTLHRAVVRLREEGRRAHDELVLDPDAWRFAIAGGAPLVFGEPASWLVTNPFVPPRRPGSSAAARGGRNGRRGHRRREEPDLARPGRRHRAQLARRPPRRGDRHRPPCASRSSARRSSAKRMRLAAELHDGLAQDLALGVRELALLESQPDPAPRPRASSDCAPRSAPRTAWSAPAWRTFRWWCIGGIPRRRPGALRPLRAARRAGLRRALAGIAPEVRPEAVAIVLRVLNEALANAERHAQATGVAVALRIAEGALELTVTDDGRGFDPARVHGPGEGHFG